MKMPRDIGPLHLVGIGGIGMSGIAEALHTLGYRVQGSDLNNNANIDRLREKGIPVSVGHKSEHIGDAKVIVASSAISRTNPELVAARDKLLPVVRRAEMLAELMRLKNAIAVGGTHGKTTTTSMVAALLDQGGIDPTVINGGIINAYGSNARMGKGDWMVVEADESDGTFVRLPADIAVVTNIDPEHLDHYGSFDNVRRAFLTFAENVPFYGFSVLCSDHPEVQKLLAQIKDRRVITYGENPQADAVVHSINPKKHGSEFALTIRDRFTDTQTEFERLFLPMPGRHNVSNAVAAIVVARELGVSHDDIRKGLSDFLGVKRRFTQVGRWKGIDILDDYAHHPVEIASVLQGARTSAQNRVIAIMQPHRYTRLQDLLNEFSTCFNLADRVIVAPVYPAGEPPIENVNHHTLVAGIHEAGHRDVRAVDSKHDIPRIIHKTAKPGDLVVFLGAGDVTYWAQSLESQLKALDESVTQAQD